MSDEMKVYTTDSPNSALTAALCSSMMNGGNMGGNGWNNPFVYLVWMMFANRYMGGNGGEQNAALQAQIQSLQGQVQDNHNSDLLMAAVNGNVEATRNLAVALNAGFDQVNAAICGVRNGITEANGNIQLAAERMLNSNSEQTGIVTSKLQEGFCGVKSAILEQGYQNQLGNCQQTNTILMQSQALQNTVQNGFTNLGFLLERNACDIKETSTMNTQKIIDTLNGHWNLEQQTTIQQLRDEVGRLNQTNTLIAALKTTSTAGA